MNIEKARRHFNRRVFSLLEDKKYEKPHESYVMERNYHEKNDKNWKDAVGS